MARPRPKTTKMKPLFGYLAVDSKGRPVNGSRSVRVNPIRDHHLMPGERCAYVVVVEMPAPKKEPRP